MFWPAKVGLGLLGLSAVIVPGSWMVISAEPAATTVAESSDQKHTGKFGEDFKYHLVNAQSGKNQGWWNWSFKYRWQIDKEDDKEEFKDVKDGNSLRDKCEEYYKKDTKTEIHASNQEKYEKAVWRYCSLEGRKPLTIKDSVHKEYELKEVDSETIGKKNESDLVSTQDLGNNKFWLIQEKAFFGTGGLGSKATEESSFKTLYTKTSRGVEDNLRNTCKLAFSKKESDHENEKKHALMFCSLLAQSK